MNKPTLISLFAGIGGLDLAAHWAGFETIRFVEKEPFCQKVLAKHWPGVPIDDDVFTSHPGYADVVCGGFPCQPFSTSGEQNGEEDERFLLPEMLRIVEEVKPYAVLFENVQGFTSLNDGSAFKFLLRCIAEMGFDGCEWGHITASDIGAPHKRERWFCVAYVVNPSKLVPSNERKSYARKLQQTVHLATSERFNREPIHSQELGNTTSERQQGENRQVFQHSQPARSSRGQIERRLARNSDGLPGRLDFVGFPARPGEPQFSYEPPRTAPSTSTTNARIKALGNAVVPQCAYPIFAAIAEWLIEINQEAAA